MSIDEHEEVGDDVQWWLDPDGTEWFVEQGVRFELADDGIAYPVVGGTTDPTGATPLEVEVVPPDELPHDADDEPRAGAGTRPDAGAGPGGTTGPGAAAASGPDQVGSAVESDLEVADEVEEEVEGDDPTVAIPVVRVGAAASAPVREAAHARTGPGGDDGEALLRLSGLDAGYGSLPVLHGVDLEIPRGRTAVMLGLNGAGKTTTALTVCGALAPWGGSVAFDGREVTGWDTRAAVEDGVVMVPEGRRVFADLSVEKNLQVGAWMYRDDDEAVTEQRERVFDYFPRLRERAGQLAGTLSGGEQQMLAIGRGLMARPRMLVVDEASMGLAPVIVHDVFEIIRQINADGVTVLLIEQNVGALEVADLGFVMEQGRVVRRLEGEQLRDRAGVSEALMG